MEHPYTPLFNRLDDIDSKLNKLLNQPKEDYTTKSYSTQEAAEICNCDPQTIRKHFHEGILRGFRAGHIINIYHSSIFDENQNIKPIKYRR